MLLNNPLHQHPQRAALHNEIHARPPEAMHAPLAISQVVMMCDAAQRDASRTHLAALLRDRHLPQPDAASTHLRMDVGAFRIRWELHTEFVSWTFTQPIPLDTDQHEPRSALHAVPQDWLLALPGECLAAMHVWALPASAPSAKALHQRMLHEDTLIGASVADGMACVYTDLSIHADGFSRMLVLTDALAPRRLGQLVQRLLEIETYRMAALLGLPAAREATSVLAFAERELAELAESIRSATPNDEPQLLNRLTKLAGQVESQHAATHARFSASAAYFELVDKRIDDIAEVRLAGLQTLREFMDRRLSPARSTCAWATRRQDALSQRVSRISNLLRTRVEIEQQLGSQALLEAMNRRQGLQLKMQSAVEGLSVAAITYYVVGLIAYLAKGAQALGWPLSSETTAAAAIPAVVLAVWWSIRKLHLRIAGQHGAID
ncbi:MAG: DUF3422 domain-containing protein [Chitinophagaceae bacterium]|nr:DUF3422 domain-containing protein [Polaromonas sp.]